MKLICFLKGIWYSIINMQLVSGHNYKEIYNSKDIQILECELCSHISLGFKGDKEND